MGKNKDFKIKSNLEFYCYLKINLPVDYKIVAEPSPDYYSEWDYNYKLFKNGKLLKEYSGNYKEIKSGFLVKEAKKLMREVGI